MRAIFAALVLCAVAVLPVVAETARVGTFDRRAIVVAYYRSALWGDLLKAKKTEMQAAKASGDTKKAAELEKWGQESQERAHQQLEGKAPIDDILASMKDGLAEAAKGAKVGQVVETVDVTEALLDWLKADAKTREIVKGLPK